MENPKQLKPDKFTIISISNASQIEILAKKISQNLHTTSESCSSSNLRTFSKSRFNEPDIQHSKTSDAKRIFQSSLKPEQNPALVYQGTQQCGDADISARKNYTGNPKDSDIFQSSLKPEQNHALVYQGTPQRGDADISARKNYTGNPKDSGIGTTVPRGSAESAEEIAAEGRNPGKVPTPEAIQPSLDSKKIAEFLTQKLSDVRTCSKSRFGELDTQHFQEPQRKVYEDVCRGSEKLENSVETIAKGRDFEQVLSLSANFSQENQSIAALFWEEIQDYVALVIIEKRLRLDLSEEAMISELVFFEEIIKNFAGFANAEMSSASAKIADWSENWAAINNCSKVSLHISTAQKPILQAFATKKFIFQDFYLSKSVSKITC